MIETTGEIDRLRARVREWKREGLRVGFTVTERSELDDWQRRLAELGVEHSPVTDTPSGSGAALVFRDPDNIQLEFWWTTPR